MLHSDFYVMRLQIFLKLSIFDSQNRNKHIMQPCKLSENVIHTWNGTLIKTKHLSTWPKGMDNVSPATKKLPIHSLCQAISSWKFNLAGHYISYLYIKLDIGQNHLKYILGSINDMATRYCTANPFPVQITGISLCSNSTL